MIASDTLSESFPVSHELVDDKVTLESRYPQIETAWAIPFRDGSNMEHGTKSHALLANALSQPIPSVHENQLNAMFATDSRNGQQPWVRARDIEGIKYSTVTHRELDDGPASYGIHYTFDQNGRLVNRELTEWFSPAQSALMVQEHFIYDEEGYLQARTTYSDPGTTTFDSFEYTDKNGTKTFTEMTRTTRDHAGNVSTAINALISPPSLAGSC
jgi:hypothetical protein